jgi:CRISPR-associated exonuclease Cas4
MFPDLPTNDDDILEIKPEDNNDLITISLLKQYIYCPRVVYYETCTPGIRPITHKMEAGSDAHEYERKRASRRTLTAYQVPEGERHFDVRVFSSALGLTGIVDEVVITPDEAIVVDYKMSRWMGDNHLIQIGAYAMLIEEVFQRPVQRGFIYLMGVRRFESIAIDDVIRNSVLETVQNVQHIRTKEYMPPPVDERNKCESCEFLRFCNDI